MDKKDFRILFMDDEFDIDSPAKDAYEKLKSMGYNIDKCGTMSEVLDGYYKIFYNLYILDIDMGSATQKEKVPYKGNGTKVGEILKCLSSMSEVIIFSARGDVSDWFASGSFHFRAYVHKNLGSFDYSEERDDSTRGGSFDDLKWEIDKAIFDADYFESPVFSVKKPKKKSVLLYYKAKGNDIELETVKNIIKKQKFDVVVTEKLDEVLENSKSSDFYATIFVAPFFDNPKSFRKILKVSKTQPTPHTIFAVEGKDDNISYIIPLINMRPFRLLNLKATNFFENLAKSLKDAEVWYGQKEIFEFPEESELVRIPVSEEDVKAIMDSDYYDEEE